ncbi:MAG: DUF86 domain-containing protein [Selenomonadaceae bacterium]|nr:DUF86 domain-containing protein [Selenomonadaceae bacterium]
MKYSDEQRLEKILNYALRLQDYISEKNITKEKILEEIELQWLVTTPLYNIGEHVYNLSKEYKESHKNIEWNMIAGLRHRLVHDYEGTNWNIIVEVIFEELPIFIEQIQKILENE